MRPLPSLVLLALPACAGIEAARRAEDPRSAAPGERTVSAGEVGLGLGSTLSLDRALEIALASNPSVAIARRHADAAEARLRQAGGPLLPQVRLSGGLNAEVSGRGISGGTEDARTHQETLAASLLLFDFGKTSALRRQAAKEFLATRADLRAAENDVVFDVRAAFFSVLRQEALVNVAEETVRQFEKRLEQTQGFVEVGTRVRYDLTKAEVDLGNARLALLQAQTALKDDRALLDAALGLAEEVAVPLEARPAGDEETPAFEALVEEARAHHPQLEAQALREDAACETIEAAIADFFPSVSLQASFARSGSFAPSAWSALLGPALDAVLYAGGEKSGRLEEVVADLRATRAAKAQIEQQLFLQIRQACTQLTDARERRKILDLTVQQATENLDLVQGRYAIGRASSVELTDGQVTLANARGSRIQARFDVEIAIAALKRSVGEVR
ncbi:MAG TPA: TolC family protein [Planctomycetota bacterium]|jgi:outer membrane protein TolC|nr:TolC family protein [Planctomycetota bacterium]